MKQRLILASCLGILVPVQAAITINFGAAELRTYLGADVVPDGSFVYVVASTLNSDFSAPTPGAFVSGDDQVIASGTASSGGWGFTLNTTYSGNWDAGDPLQLYWFPGLTSLSTTPSAGDHYGAYRTDAVSPQSTIGWTSPTDGSVLNDLTLLTTTKGGPTAPSAGYADLTVVPEPAAYGMVLGVLSLAGAVVFRRIKK